MTLTAAVLAATTRLAASPAYAEGAPPGFSGGFKEDSCHACHFHEQPNSSGGRVTIEGVPASFEAGQRDSAYPALKEAFYMRGERPDRAHHLGHDKGSTAGDRAFRDAVQQLLDEIPAD